MAVPYDAWGDAYFWLSVPDNVSVIDIFSDVSMATAGSTPFKNRRFCQLPEGCNRWAGLGGKPPWPPITN
ncbi:MAG: hypothetical protein AAGC54_11410 [Cyanobacteria bacterium P01_F01_bin.4]